jgi:MYXO-CTERM domain-containing protein
MRPLLLLACGILVACTAPRTRETVRETRQPIINGSPSTSSEDATVMLSIDGEFACTGTLVTPNLMVTARHCVSDLDEESECVLVTKDLPVKGFAVSVGVDAKPDAPVAHVKRVFAPVADKEICGADIAVLQLDKDITNAKIAPVRFEPLTVGEKTVAVGYGETGSGDLPPQRLRRGDVEITAVGPAKHTFKPQTGKSIKVNVPGGDFETGESTCFGDSGGPLFDAEGRLVGVTSRGVDEECFDRPSLWTALPQHKKLIEDAASEAGHSLEEADQPKPQTTDLPTQKDEADEDEDAEESEETPAQDKKKKKAATPQPTAVGCSAGGPTGAAPMWAGIAVIAALGRRRRKSIARNRI